MQELTFIRRGKLEWHDVPEPELRGHLDALVRPTVAARCDLDFFTLMGMIPFKGPFPIGHEIVGEIMSVGAGVRNFKAGQMVALPCNISCGICPRCESGTTAFCETTHKGAYGIDPTFGGSWGGGISDLVRVPYADAMLVAIPDCVAPASVAALGDNISDGYRTVGPFLEANAHQSVLVVGGVAVGLYAAAIARALGCPRVDYLDTNPQLLEMARTAGVNTIDASILDPVRAKYPIVVDASARVEGLTYALRSLEPGGTCTSASMHFTNDVPIPFMDMYETDATLKIGRTNARMVMEKALALVESGDFKPELFTNKVISWKDAAKGYRERAVKLIVARD